MDIIFSALAEPNRLRMVEFLRDGPRSVSDIVERLGLKQPLVSKHLRSLAGAGLVRARPVAQRRIYELDQTTFKEIDMWLTSFSELWGQSLDKLDALLQKEKGRNRNGK